VVLVALVVAAVVWLTWEGVTHGFGVFSFVFVAFLLLFLAAGWTFGRKTLRGDKTRDEAQEARVGRILDRLCLLADAPRPEVRVPGGLPPLTWTTQLPGGRPTINVSQAMADELDDPQLEAAIAHELAHVINGDAWMMTVVGGPATVLLSGLWWCWGTSSRKVAVILLTCWMAPILLLAMLFSRVVSRQRELAADRSAAALTGSAATLSATLLRLSGALEQTRDRDLRAVAAADVFHLLPVRDPSGIRRLWATHPPLAVRLAELEAMERHLQR
jgi:heat shock protein HtpX